MCILITFCTYGFQNCLFVIKKPKMNPSPSVFANKSNLLENGDNNKKKIRFNGILEPSKWLLNIKVNKIHLKREIIFKNKTVNFCSCDSTERLIKVVKE